MSLGPRLTHVMGFDPEFQEGLDARYRRGLQLVCALGVLPVVLIGGAAGYGLWLLERSLLLATAGVLGISLFVLNLLRVSIAGSGMTLHFERRRAAKWRPRTTPVFMFLLLGGFFAQPALLAFQGAAVDADITSYRRAMVEARARAVRASDPKKAHEIVATYEARLAETTFAVRRLQRLWQEPTVPATFTASFCLVVLVPLLLVRGSRLAAVRAYEGRRYNRSRARILAEHARMRTTIDGLLAVYPGYLGPAPLCFLDEPFCNEPATPRLEGGSSDDRS